MIVALMLLACSACQPLRVPLPIGETRPASSPPAGRQVQATPLAAMPAQPASRGDDIYAPGSNVDAFQAVARDVADIERLLDQIGQSRPFPASEIMTIYDQGRHARVGEAGSSLAGFATSPVRSREFPEEAGFYGTATFLDDPLRAAIAGTGSAAPYGPEQRRQAVQKGLLRLQRYWTLQGLINAEPKLRAGQIDAVSGAPRDVDVAWAVYVGPDATSPTPGSLASAARQLEANFGRQGTIDRPLRTALARAQQAAFQNNRAEFRAGRQEATARLNMIFYLEVARDLTEMARAAQAGNVAGAANVQVAGHSAYLAIQPTVAIADPAVDQTLVAVLRAEPAGLTLTHRNEALEALNRVASALGLTAADIVRPADFRDQPTPVATPGTVTPTPSTAR